MALSIDIEKTLGDFHLRVSFEANDEIFALLGASGCGKSMTLKCIAGIERPDRGRIVLDGRVLFDSEKGIDLKPQERRAGYLFQQYALFPNMTVRQNIRCGLRREGEKHVRKARGADSLDYGLSFRGKNPVRNARAAEPLGHGLSFRRENPVRNARVAEPLGHGLSFRGKNPVRNAQAADSFRGENPVHNSRAADRRVDEIIHAMQLDGLEDRKPSQLSGGQQQRVALSRILINEPDIVMLDEPFSALDSHLRFSVERDVRHLMQEFGKTVLLISHDRDEVFRMADSIAIMDSGHTEVVGSKYSVFMNPRTVSGARLTGCKNVTECRRVSDKCVRAEAWGMTLETGRPVDGARFVGIRMHDVYVWRSEEREVKERRLSAIPESVLRGSLHGPGFEAASNSNTSSAGRTDMCKVQNDAGNVDVSTWNRSDVYGGQTVSRNNIDISPLDQSDICKVSHTIKKKHLSGGFFCAPDLVWAFGESAKPKEDYSRGT